MTTATAGGAEHNQPVAEYPRGGDSSWEVEVRLGRFRRLRVRFYWFHALGSWQGPFRTRTGHSPVPLSWSFMPWAS